MGLNDLTCDCNETLSATAEAIASGVKQYEPFADRQFIYMNDYDVIDYGVEAAIYEDGVTVAGNFTDTDKEYMGHTVPANDFIVF